MSLTVPVLDAATVLPVRDGDAGLEVLMLRRNLESGFVPGAYLFPGGAVDAADEDGGHDPFRVAAIRECFEEAGLLLARDASGAHPDTSDARFAAHRAAIAAGRESIQRVCASEGLTLAADELHPLSRWVTPEGAPRRYDTRFFVALAPPEQVPMHDDHEAIDHLWIRPADALARNERGDYELILPTLMSLRTLAEHDAATDVIASLLHPDVHPHRG
jgi:8-oxo-dGTP pyrophosphatase MutT (NUDIX family)